jgi:hypothetical protein
VAERTTDGEAMLYLHHVPGRLHLRLAALKGDGSAAARACAIAKAIPGVVDARTNGAGAARAEPSPPADSGAQPFRDNLCPRRARPPRAALGAGAGRRSRLIFS